MTEEKPNISVNVDVTNPGQFFACCGLLELAGRVSPGAEGWFEKASFCLHTGPFLTLSRLLSEIIAMEFDVGSDSGTNADDSNDGDLPVQPIRLKWKDNCEAIQLDWWSDKSIKPWAGSMKERVILRAMLDAIEPTMHDPFNDLKAVVYKSAKKKKPTKKEPFYFDPRRGNKSHPLDSGFSPDVHKMESECCAVLEGLCFIGLQRARPAPTGIASQSRYTVWSQPIPASLVGPVVCRVVRLPNAMTYVFENYYRTDQHKHKTFSQARLERSTNG